MKSKSKPTQEPVGIVISGFPRQLPPSVFSAYVWAPAPQQADDAERKAG
jgi:hypothetical protein